jgi:hypothetical protein
MKPHFTLLQLGEYFLEYFNTQYKMFSYLSDRFTIDDRRGIVIGEIYGRYRLNVSVPIFKVCRARCSAFSSGSAPTSQTPLSPFMDKYSQKFQI